MDQKYLVAALKSGFSETSIAQSMGVSPSAVHQYIEEHGLKEIAAQNSRFRNIDDGLNSIEEKLVRKLNKSLDLAVLNPMQLGNLLKTINGAKRRSLAEGANIVDNSTHFVQINLPKREMPKVTKNRNNEVIEVEGETFKTLPSGKLTEEVKHAEKSENSAEKLPEIKDLL